MKISELRRAAALPLSTIKYYIREGLLPPGVATGRNQANYGPEHLKRLKLIRSLREDAALPLATITQVLRAADCAEGEPVLAAVDALDPAAGGIEPADQALEEASELILEVAETLGWQVERADVSLASAARALATLLPAFPQQGLDSILPYFQAAMDIARLELADENWEAVGSQEDALQYALLGTVLFEPFILSLRRMAHVTRMREIRAQPSSEQSGRRSTAALEESAETKPPSPQNGSSAT